MPECIPDLTFIEPDWTRLDEREPFLNKSNCKYSITVRSEFDSPGGDQLPERLKIAAHKGVRSLFDFLGKEYSDADINRIIPLILQDVDYFVDPRPGCVPMKVRVQVPVSMVDNFFNIVFVKPASEYEVVFDSFAMRGQFNLVASKLYDYAHAMWKNNTDLYVNGYAVDVVKLADLYQNFIARLENLIRSNDLSYGEDVHDQIVIGFGKNLNVLYCIFNGAPLLKGLNVFNQWPSTKDVSAISLVINIKEALLFFKQDGGLNLWSSFFEKFILAKVTFQKSERALLKQKANDLSTFDELKKILNDSITFDNLGKILENSAAYKEIENLIAELSNPFAQDCRNINFDYFSKCGSISFFDLAESSEEDIEKILISSIRTKKIEDTLIDDPKFKANVLDIRAKHEDLVGDLCLSNLTFSLPSPNTNILYDEIFNKFDIQELLAKILRCLNFEIPLFCFNLPDLSSEFPDFLFTFDIFGFISDLIISLILLLIQELLIFIINLIIGLLTDCETYSEFDLEAFLEDDEIGKVNSVFGKNFNEAEKFFKKKYKDVRDSGDLPSVSVGDDIDTRKFLEELFGMLTPQEICRLLTGAPSTKVIEIILCLINKKYVSFLKLLGEPYKIVSFFKSLGGLVKPEFCERVEAILQPIDGSLCITPAFRDVRKALLEKKDLTSEQLDKQLRDAQERREKDLNILSGLFNSDKPLEDLLYKGQDPLQFVRDLVPCVKENGPLAHMVGITFDAVLEPVKTFFVEGLVGEGSVTSVLFKNNADLKSIRDEIFSSDFLHVADLGTFALKGKNFSLSYVQRGTNYDNASENMILFGNSLEVKNPAKEKVRNLVHERNISDSNNSIQRKVFAKFMTNNLTSLLSLPPNKFASIIEKFENDIFDNFFASVYQIYALDNASSKIVSMPENVLASRIKALVPTTTKEIPILESAWREETSSLREGMLETYFTKECETKDALVLQDVTSEGVLYLFLRSIVLEHVLQDLPMITQFHTNDYFDGFVTQKIRAGVKRRSGNKFGLLIALAGRVTKERNITLHGSPLDFLVEEQFKSVTDDLKAIFSDDMRDGLLDDGLGAYRLLVSQAPVVKIPSDSFDKRFAASFEDVDLNLGVYKEKFISEKLSMDLNGFITPFKISERGGFFFERYIRIEDKGTNEYSGREHYRHGIANIDRWFNYIQGANDKTPHTEKFKNWKYGVRLNFLLAKSHNSFFTELYDSLSTEKKNLLSSEKTYYLEDPSLTEVRNDVWFSIPIVSREIPLSPQHKISDPLPEFPEAVLVAEILNSAEFSLLFDFCCNVKNILSSISVYNAVRTVVNVTNGGLKELSLMLLMTLDGLINIGDFTYKTDEMENNSLRNRRNILGELNIISDKDGLDMLFQQLFSEEQEVIITTEVNSGSKSRKILMEYGENSEKIPETETNDFTKKTSTGSTQTELDKDKIKIIPSNFDNKRK